VLCAVPPFEQPGSRRRSPWPRIQHAMRRLPVLVACGLHIGAALPHPDAAFSPLGARRRHIDRVEATRLWALGSTTVGASTTASAPPRTSRGIVTIEHKKERGKPYLPEPDFAQPEHAAAVAEPPTPSAFVWLLFFALGLAGMAATYVVGQWQDSKAAEQILRYESRRRSGSWSANADFQSSLALADSRPASSEGREGAGVLSDSLRSGPPMYGGAQPEANRLPSLSSA